MARMLERALAAAARDGDPVLDGCHREAASSAADDLGAWQAALWLFVERRLVAPTRATRIRGRDFAVEGREVEALRTKLASALATLARQITDGRRPRASATPLPALSVVLTREVPIQL